MLFIRMAVAITVMLTCTFSIKSNAQNKLSKYEFGINAGLFLYQGDLTPRVEGAVETPGFGVNIFASRILSPSFSLRTNLGIGSLSGDDSRYAKPEWRRQRNFNFHTPLIEVSESLVWNFLRKNNTQSGLSPYVYGGIGVNFVNIHRDASRFNPEAFEADPQIEIGLQEDLETVSGLLLVVVVMAQQAGRPAGEIGAIGAVLGAGGVVGAVLAPRFRHALTPYAALMTLTWAAAVLVPLLAVVPLGYASGLVLAAIALLAPTATAIVTTYQMLVTPDEMRGRLAGVIGVSMSAASALGPLIGGVLLQTVGGTSTVLVCTAALGAIALVVTLGRTVRAFPRLKELEGPAT